MRTARHTTSCASISAMAAISRAGTSPPGPLGPWRGGRWIRLSPLPGGPLSGPADKPQKRRISRKQKGRSSASTDPVWALIRGDSGGFRHWNGASAHSPRAEQRPTVTLCRLHRARSRASRSRGFSARLEPFRRAIARPRPARGPTSAFVAARREPCGSARAAERERASGSMILSLRLWRPSAPTERHVRQYSLPDCTSV